jgi:hypothetical protein
VVPVAVFGQERISASARRLRRAPVRIRIAPPIAPFDSEPTAHALRAWTDRLMTEIARRLPAAYRGVYADSASDAGVLD